MSARAMLICNSTFAADPARLPDLRGPQADVLHVWAALTDDRVGIFDHSNVLPILERDSNQIKKAAEMFFSQAREDDTVLFYYSGHGYRTPQELFLCASDTNTEFILSTAIGSNILKRMVDACLALRIIILLDCCYAGAFKGDQLSTKELAGEGVVVLAAAGPLERAPDAEEASGPSPFTAALCTALRHAAEDRDMDGYVELDEVIGSMRLTLKRAGLGIYPHLEGEIGPTVVARRDLHDPLLLSARGGANRSSPPTKVIASTLRRHSRLSHEEAARELESKDPDLILAVLNEMPLRQAAGVVDNFSRGLATWLLVTMPPKRASFILTELADISQRWLGRESKHFGILVDMDEQEAVTLLKSLTPGAAALLLSGAPTSLAAQLVSELAKDKTLTILAKIREPETLAGVLEVLPTAYAVNILKSEPGIAGSILGHLSPKLGARILKDHYAREKAIDLLADMWESRSETILAHLDIDWFCDVADRLPEIRLARLLEHRSAQAREFLIRRVTTEKGARLITLMDPQQANWLLDGVSDEDMIRLLGEMSVIERVMLYIIDPAKYDAVMEALKDGPGFGWQQDEQTLQRFSGLLAEAEPRRANRALLAASWQQAADLLVLMPPRSAARLCMQWSDFESTQSLGFTFYRMRPTDAARILEKVPRDWAEECLLHLGPPHAYRILEKLNNEFALRILEGVEPKEAAALLKGAGADRIDEILKSIDPEVGQEIRRICEGANEEGEL